MANETQEKEPKEKEGSTGKTKEKEMPVEKLKPRMTPFFKEEGYWRSLFVGGLLVIIVGVVSGYFLSQKGISLPQGKKIGSPKKIVGAKDTSVFKDSAVGVIEKGGLNGEGTHKLIREGGPSQTAYLISSVLDLNEFIGQKVKVWGETFTGEQAAWFMDVGRVEVLE